jgi:hypothetical protein
MPTAKTDPTEPAPLAYVPIRMTAWPTRRVPRWVIGAGAVLLAVAVAVGLSHRPTAGQRAADLRSFLHELTTDVESCSGGVRESLYVLRQIDAGASHDVPTALRVARTAAANCSPANNELLAALTAAQPPESLASYHLRNAVKALIDWAAPDAQRVAAAAAAVLTNRGTLGEPNARATLRGALSKLDAQRGVVYAALRPAIKTLDPESAPPVLYG